MDSQNPKIYIPGFKGILKTKLGRKKIGGDHFDYRWKADSWLTSRKTLGRSNNYFSSYHDNKEFSN